MRTLTPTTTAGNGRTRMGEGIAVGALIGTVGIFYLCLLVAILDE